MRYLIVVLTILVMVCGAYAKGGGHSGGHAGHSSGHSGKHSGGHASHSKSSGGSSHHSKSTGDHAKQSTASPSNGSGHHTSRYATDAPRDSRGKIKRNEAAEKEFMRMTGHPNGWPGHVVDHIVPLAKGGKDDPSNMQWQTVEEAKAKDKWERK